jgi:hypothetical protein
VRLCAYCDEEIGDGDSVMPFNNGEVLMHRNCGLRGITGCVAHLNRTCSCFVPGSTELDPPGMTRREAADAAVRLWEQQKGCEA